MSRARRYSGGQKKLNMKKVAAVIIAIAVIIMFVIVITKLLKTKPKEETKVAVLSYHSVYTQNKWGVINSKGEIVVAPEYDEMIIVPDGTKNVFLCTYDVNYENNTYQTKAINEKNEVLFSNYHSVQALINYDKQNNVFYEKNCLKVEKDGKYGLIDYNGKEILPVDYSDIIPIQGATNSLITTKDNKKGLVDCTGNVIIPNEYVQIASLTEKYENGYIVKNDNGKYGIIGYNKKVVVEPKYEEIKHVYSSTMYVVKEGKTWEIIDIEGNTSLENKFDDVKSIDGDMIVIQKGKSYGVIDKNGNEKIPTSYQDLTYLFQDYYIAKKDGKYGIIDSANQEKMAFTYQNLFYRKDADFIEGQKEDVNTDLIGRDLQIKLTGIVSEINIDKGYMKVRTGDEYQYYNFKFEEKKNTELLKNNTLFLDKKDGKYGYVNKQGVVMVNYIYDDATEQNDSGFVSVKKDNKWGALDQKGKVVVEPTYSLDENAVVDFIGKWHVSEDLNANYYTDEK